MPGMTTNTKSTRSLEWFLAGIGTAVCLIVSVRIWQVLSDQQSMWPLPSLYLLEIIAMSFVGLFGILQGDAARAAVVGALPWITSGVLLAFVVLGAWSIGFLFLPVALIFLITAILADRRRRRNLIVDAGVGIAAALTQVALMLAVIRLLYPDAVL